MGCELKDKLNELNKLKGRMIDRNAHTDEMQIVYSAIADIEAQIVSKMLVKQDLITKEPLVYEGSNSPVVSRSNDTFTNNTGGAYGADTDWDLIGRKYSANIDVKHFRSKGNMNPSKRLVASGSNVVEATVDEMKYGYEMLAKARGSKQTVNRDNDLAARNVLQVANSDGIYAIATKINDDRASIPGGTNYALKYAKELDKNIFVFSIEDASWFGMKDGKLEKISTPKLSNNFAGIGTRNMENYGIGTRNMENYTKGDGKGSFVPNPEYLGDEARSVAINAIEDVYVKTFGKDSIKAFYIQMGEVDAGKIFNGDIKPWKLAQGDLWVMRVSFGIAKYLKDRTVNLENNFGNPFLPAAPKALNSGEKVVNTSRVSASEMYYNWLTKNELPIEYAEQVDRDALNEKRKWILKNLEKVNQAKRLIYSGTAKDEEISHVHALIAIANKPTLISGSKVEEEVAGSAIIDTVDVDGNPAKVTVITDVINSAAEKYIVKQIETILDAEGMDVVSLKDGHSSVAFGDVDYKYGRHTHLKKAQKTWMKRLSAIMDEKFGKAEGYYNHMLINKYDYVDATRAKGIGAHTDSEYIYQEKDGSVGSVVVMSIGKSSEQANYGGKDINLKSRSSVEMSTGKIKHTAPAPAGLRYSVTFRHVPEFKIKIMNQKINNVVPEPLVSVGKVIIEEEYYTREMVKANPGSLYLFGENYADSMDKNIGEVKSTQAVIRGEENAFGVITKKTRKKSDEAYLNDADIEKYAKYIAKLESEIDKKRKLGATIVLPKDGIGTGAAKLKEKAPMSYNLLAGVLNRLAGYQYMEMIEATKEPLVGKIIDIDEATGLNKQQLQAYNKTADVMRSDTNHVMVIEGEGGSGKSYMVGRVISDLLNKDKRSELIGDSVIGEVYVGATAHVAKDIIGESIDNRIDKDIEDGENIDSKQVERFVAVQLDQIIDKIRASAVEVGDNGKQKIHIIALDEMSMIDYSSTRWNDGLEEAIRVIDSFNSSALAKQAKTSIKLLMMGDRAQLRPIKSETKSHVFKEYSDNNSGSYQMLNAQMRQNDVDRASTVRSFRTTVVSEDKYGDYMQSNHALLQNAIDGVYANDKIESPESDHAFNYLIGANADAIMMGDAVFFVRSNAMVTSINSNLSKIMADRLGQRDVFDSSGAYNTQKFILGVNIGKGDNKITNNTQVSLTNIEPLSSVSVFNNTPKNYYAGSLVNNAVESYLKSKYGQDADSSNKEYGINISIGNIDDSLSGLLTKADITVQNSDGDYENKGAEGFINPSKIDQFAPVFVQGKKPMPKQIAKDLVGSMVAKVTYKGALNGLVISIEDLVNENQTMIMQKGNRSDHKDEIIAVLSEEVVDLMKIGNPIYASTFHKAQGRTVKKSIVIDTMQVTDLDSKGNKQSKYGMSPVEKSEMLYVGLGRATDEIAYYAASKYYGAKQAGVGIANAVSRAYANSSQAIAQEVIGKSASNGYNNTTNITSDYTNERRGDC